MKNSSCRRLEWRQILPLSWTLDTDQLDRTPEHSRLAKSAGCGTAMLLRSCTISLVGTANEHRFATTSKNYKIG